MKTLLCIFAGLALAVGLRAQAAQLTLAWDYSQGTLPAVGFEVERSPGPPAATAFSKVNVVPASSPTGSASYSWTDTTLTAGLTYMYRVRAYNDGGVQSSYSNVASGVAAILPPPPPNGTYGPTPTAKPPPKYIALAPNSKKVIYNGALAVFGGSKINITFNDLVQLSSNESALVVLQ